MSPALEGAIDCDVHVAPASIDALTPHMDDYWRDYLANAGLVLSPNLGGSYPPSAPAPPADLDALRAQVLDPWGLRHAVLTCLTAFDASRNAYYEAALCSAINDWLRAEWLERDERLRAYMAIPTLDTEAAVTEIERVGSHDGFVGVLVPVRTETRWGNRRFHELHEAIAAQELVLALHAWGRVGGAPTLTGFTHTYFEDYLSNSQMVVQAQVLSLVTEGVFERVPALRVVLLECGFSWLPPLLWRFDKDWKAVWREVPWVKRRPSEYVREHIRLTTAPAQLPTDPAVLARIGDLMPVTEMLLYASDHPHDHGDSGGALLRELGTADVEAILRGNATAFYGQSVS
jgi:predicted TIM-barrel fold metal-dependent hydrolase